MADWETVREIALSFPEAEEDTAGSRPTFRVRGKLFAWMARERDGGGLAVRVEDAWLIQAPRRLAAEFLAGS